MIIRKNIRIPFSYISFFILLSCSKKSDHLANTTSFILNTFTYTLTDTTGVNHIFSDTARLNSDGSYDYLLDGRYRVANPVAFIWQPYPDSKLLHQFFFTGNDNSLLFCLPYFQASVSETNNFVTAPLLLVWEGVYYDAVQPESPNGNPGWVYLASFTTSTNISDSTGGYVTGSFNISATTIDSGKIKISGQFSHLPTNYKP